MRDIREYHTCDMYRLYIFLHTFSTNFTLYSLYRHFHSKSKKLKFKKKYTMQKEFNGILLYMYDLRKHAKTEKHEKST